MESQRLTARALLEVDALRFNPSDPFVYASRKIGPIYIDVRQLSSNPALWAQVVGELANFVDREGASGGLDVISGGELGDLLFSIPVALRMGKPHAIIRKAEKTYGAGGRIAGRLGKGQRVAHVSDLITSGSSAADWIRVIRGAGGEIEHYFVVVDRKQGGGEALKAAGVRLHALLSLDGSFIRLAADDGMLSQEDAERISDYLDDPERWATNLLTAHPEILERHLNVREGRLVVGEGIEILSKGYPALSSGLAPFLRERLRAMGLREPLDSLD